MFNDLTALGYGLVVFAIIIGVGTIVLYNFGSAVANCSGLLESGSWNQSSSVCSNLTASVTPAGSAYTNTNYLTGQLGTTGLAGWTPAIIAISVGILFLGAFMIGGKGRK